MSRRKSWSRGRRQPNSGIFWFCLAQQGLDPEKEAEGKKIRRRADFAVRIEKPMESNVRRSDEASPRTRIDG